MNLVIDIGNTSVKAALFENGEIVDRFRSPGCDSAFLDAVFDSHPGISAAISVSTRGSDSVLAETFRGRACRYMELDASAKIPLANRYGTPGTLGYDRLAAAVGAAVLYPRRNRLVVDFGTAITYDVVTEKDEYLGGNISPGAAIRFRALHEYTGKLPLGSLTNDFRLVADNTLDAVRSGCIKGIVFETEGYIRELDERYEGLCVIFTGGDADFFAKQLKNPIFANHDLVLYGLNRILEYNAV